MLQLNQTLTLASQSPRRKELLEQMQLPFTTNVSNVEEPRREEGECVATYVQRLASLKSKAVAKRVGGVVIGADTVVSIDGDLLGKPPTKRAAAQLLRRLSGRTHDVYTGVSIVNGAEERTFYERTRVVFRALDEALIRAYVATGDSLDKAGGYGIQTLGALCVERIEGDYNNVVGLPVARLVHVLMEEGIVEPKKVTRLVSDD